MKLLLILLLVTCLVAVSLQKKNDNKKILGSGELLSDKKAQKVLKKQIGGDFKKILNENDKDNVFVNYDETDPEHVQVLAQIVEKLQDAYPANNITGGDGPAEILNKMQDLDKIKNYLGGSDDDQVKMMAENLLFIYQHEDIDTKGLVAWSASIMDWAKDELKDNDMDLEIVAKVIELVKEQLVILDDLDSDIMKDSFIELFQFVLTEVETKSGGEHWEAIKNLMGGFNTVLSEYKECPDKMNEDLDKLVMLIGNAMQSLDEKWQANQMSSDMTAEFFWSMEKTNVLYEHPCELEVNLDESGSPGGPGGIQFENDDSSPFSGISLM